VVIINTVLSQCLQGWHRNAQELLPQVKCLFFQLDITSECLLAAAVVHTPVPCAASNGN
jgi:hypothetical protein